MDRIKIAAALVLGVLIVAVVGAGVAHNDISYTSTAALLVGAFTLLVSGKKPGDDDE